MRLTTLLLAFAFACAAQAAGNDESFQGAPQRGAASAPSQYSFADLYGLAVAGPSSAPFFIVPANDAPVRASAAPAPAQFSVADTPKPELWLLLLSGLAAAVWVARRRLGYGF